MMDEELKSEHVDWRERASKLSWSEMIDVVNSATSIDDLPQYYDVTPIIKKAKEEGGDEGLENLFDFYCVVDEKWDKLKKGKK